MDILAGIAAATQALDIAKRIKGINDGLKDAELKLQIAELYEKLADVKISFADAKIELQEKDAEILALKERVSIKIPTVRFGAYEYGLNADGAHFPRPFCPKCSQSAGLQISLTRTPNGRNTCPSCNASFDPRETSAPSGG